MAYPGLILGSHRISLWAEMMHRLRYSFFQLIQRGMTPSIWGQCPKQSMSISFSSSEYHGWPYQRSRSRVEALKELSGLSWWLRTNLRWRRFQAYLSIGNAGMPTDVPAIAWLHLDDRWDDEWKLSPKTC